MDFGNFVVKGDFTMHYAPDVSGAGSDSTGAFNESSSASTYSFGVLLELIPYISQNHRERILVRIGGGEAIAHLTNTRNYPTITNIEKDGTSTQYYLLGAGYEFFLLQNYSLEMGLDYRSMNFGSFTYTSGSNVAGGSVIAGNTVKQTSGAAKGFNLSGVNFSVAFNLHF
jgi:hypothetical protein